MRTELTSLQRAYLLGRSDYVPLGGVAMQEFREYRGRFDLAVLEERLTSLAERHDSLRTVIDRKSYEKHVAEKAVVDFELIDLSTLAPADALKKLDTFKDDFSHELFSLDDPPWCVRAFRLPEPVDETDDTCAIFFRFDALILDGFSIASLLVELFNAEFEVRKKSPSSSSSPDRDEDEAARDAAYWKSKLRAYENAPQLPWKKPLGAIKTSRYQRDNLTIDRERFRTLKRVGAKSGLFQNTVLSAIVLEVLSFWLSEGALCAGIPAAPNAGDVYANRSTFFAVNWDTRNDGSLSEHASRLQANVLEGLQHLSFSGVEINRFLLDAGAGENAVALPVVLTNGLSWPTLAGDHPLRMHGGLTQTPQVALDVRLTSNHQGELLIDMDYAVEAIDQAVIRDMLNAIDRAINVICENELFQFSATDVLAFDHYHFNTAEGAYPGYDYLKCIADNLFGSQPQGSALINGERRVSYDELGTGVSRAMNFLHARGAEKGQVAVLALPRSPEQTMLTLACALTGVVWVPVDPTSPPDRMKFLFDNCAPDIAIGHAPVEGYDIIAPETILNTEPAENPHDLMPPLTSLSSSKEAAYYLYTSGTTGKPKCVVLSNRSTDNVIGCTNAEWDITEDDVFLQVSPLHHDMSVYEIFGCLTAGATLVQPAAGEEKDALRWNQLVKEHSVTIWSSVPTIFEMLLSCRQEDDLDTLRLINQGGDYLKPAVIAELRRTNPSTRLSSIGGPTETTIWSIWHRISPEDTGNIPYGHPLSANRYFVLNEREEHCPPMVVGRIYSSGVNIALGYLEDAKLRQHDFVTIQDKTGQSLRAFRSGDRGRYRHDGTILFDSRVQGYIKVRGIRISIPDVENELVRHPGVSRILMTDIGDERHGQTELAALYVVKEGHQLEDADLRSFARQQLPESHIPARLLKVDSIPLSANGKPDRRKARTFFTSAPEDAAKETKRASSQSRRVLDIYLDVLGQAPDNDTDETTDFIAIGLLPSHLKSISVRLRQELGVDLPPKQLLPCRNADQVQLLVSTHRP